MAAAVGEVLDRAAGVLTELASLDLDGVGDAALTVGPVTTRDLRRPTREARRVRSSVVTAPHARGRRRQQASAVLHHPSPKPGPIAADGL